MIFFCFFKLLLCSYGIEQIYKPLYNNVTVRRNLCMVYSFSSFQKTVNLIFFRYKMSKIKSVIQDVEFNFYIYLNKINGRSWEFLHKEKLISVLNVYG